MKNDDKKVQKAKYAKPSLIKHKKLKDITAGVLSRSTGFKNT